MTYNKSKKTTAKSYLEYLKDKRMELDTYRQSLAKQIKKIEEVIKN